MMAELQKDWQDNEINLLDYWRVVRKRGRMIISLVVVAVLVAGCYNYFFAVKIYESKASILPPRESATGGGLASALAASGVASLLGNLMTTSGGGTAQTFTAILKSRSMVEDLVARFKLKEYYEVEYTIQAVEALQGSTEILISKDGVISVKVEDKDPRLAADLANAFITNLDRMYAKFGTTEGSRQKAFIGDRLDKTEKALRQAEDTLRRFQETHKAIGVQDQAREGILETSRLRGEVIAAEVVLEALRGYGTENNLQVLQQKARVEELKRQLAQMQYSVGRNLPSETRQPGQGRQDFSIPAVKVPEITMEFGRLFREVKIQETVFALLTQQFEQAKIIEARDAPTVQFLDKAVPAEFKSKPRVKLIMAIVGALSLFIGIFLALFLEYLNRVHSLEHSPGS
jgi:tyrosine-protein kinase Etk/Wzc